MCRRCCLNRRQFATGVVDTGGKFAAGIVETGGKFAAGITDTVGKFAAGIVDTQYQQHQQNLWKNLLTLVAILLWCC
jgi:hypothetical protein